MNITVKKITASAVMVALLVVLQLTLSFLAGVELVTPFFLVFCVVYGVSAGCLTATAFSLVRCFLFGFSPNVILLYLIYFNLFALAFGGVFKRAKIREIACPVLLVFLLSFTLFFALFPLPVNALLKGNFTVISWVLFALVCLLGLGYALLLFLWKKREGRELAAAVLFAALFTVFFTLLDDVVTPLYFGYSKEGALAYFYASLLPMLTQTVCAVVSVGVLYLPLKKVFNQTRIG